MAQVVHIVHQDFYAREYQNDMREERRYYGRLPTKANIAEFYREQKTTSHPSRLR